MKEPRYMAFLPHLRLQACYALCPFGWGRGSEVALPPSSAPASVTAIVKAAGRANRCNREGMR